MKKFLFILLSGSLVVSLSACSLFPSNDNGGSTTSKKATTKKTEDIDPAVVIKDMQKSMQDVDTASYKLTASVDVDADKDGSGSLDLSLEGYESIMDKNAPEGFFTLASNFNMDANDTKMSGNAELDFSYADAMAYLELNELSLEGKGLDAVTEMAQEYLGTWYSMPFEVKASDFELSNFSKDFSKEFRAGLTEDQELTDDQAAAIDALVNDTEWLETTSNKGIKTVDGVEVYEFDVKLQKDNVLTFLQEFADIVGEEITAEELDQARTVLDTVTFEGTLQIGVDNNYLYGFDGTFGFEFTEDMKAMGGQNIMMNVNLSLSLSDFGKEKNVDVPEDAQDLTEVIGGMMGGGTTNYDNYDYENYDNMDTGASDEGLDAWGADLETGVEDVGGDAVKDIETDMTGNKDLETTESK